MLLSFVLLGFFRINITNGMTCSARLSLCAFFLEISFALPLTVRKGFHKFPQSGSLPQCMLIKNMLIRFMVKNLYRNIYK